MIIVGHSPVFSRFPDHAMDSNHLFFPLHSGYYCHLVQTEIVQRKKGRVTQLIQK